MSNNPTLIEKFAQRILTAERDWAKAQEELRSAKSAEKEALAYLCALKDAREIIKGHSGEIGE